MILDEIGNARRYLGLHPRVDRAFTYILNFDAAVPDGIYELEGDDVFARPHRYVTLPEMERRWESHRRYVDLQYIVSGEEMILYAPVNSLLHPTPYNEQKDVFNYKGAGGAVSRLILTAGSFALFFQEDGHKPSISVRNGERVRKVVVKIDLEA